MCRIGRRLRSGHASVCGADVEIRPFDYLSSNPWLRGHCLVGSLTGVVTSERVTEVSQGPLMPDGNRQGSAIAEAGLTVRHTGRSGTKVGYSDPVVPHGRAIAQRIKGTPGITG